MHHKYLNLSYTAKGTVIKAYPNTETNVELVGWRFFCDKRHICGMNRQNFNQRIRETVAIQKSKRSCWVSYLWNESTE